MAEGRCLQNGVIPCTVLQVCTLQYTSQQHLISSSSLRGSKQRKDQVGRETFALLHPGDCLELHSLGASAPGGLHGVLVPLVLQRERSDALQNLIVYSLGTVKDTEEALYD